MGHSLDFLSLRASKEWSVPPALSTTLLPRKNVRHSLESWTQGKMSGSPCKSMTEQFLCCCHVVLDTILPPEFLQLFLSELLPSHSLHPPRAKHSAHILSMFILEVLPSLHGQSLNEVLSFLSFPTCPRPVSLIPILLYLYKLCALSCSLLPFFSPGWTCFNFPLWEEDW